MWGSFDVTQQWPKDSFLSHPWHQPIRLLLYIPISYIGNSTIGTECFVQWFWGLEGSISEWGLRIWEPPMNFTEFATLASAIKLSTNATCRPINNWIKGRCRHCDSSDIGVDGHRRTARQRGGCVHFRRCRGSEGFSLIRRIADEKRFSTTGITIYPPLELPVLLRICLTGILADIQAFPPSSFYNEMTRSLVFFRLQPNRSATSLHTMVLKVGTRLESFKL